MQKCRNYLEATFWWRNGLFLFFFIFQGFFLCSASTQTSTCLFSRQSRETVLKRLLKQWQPDIGREYWTRNPKTLGSCCATETFISRSHSPFPLWNEGSGEKWLPRSLWLWHVSDSEKQKAPSEGECSLEVTVPVPILTWGIQPSFTVGKPVHLHPLPSFSPIWAWENLWSLRPRDLWQVSMHSSSPHKPHPPVWKAVAESHLPPVFNWCFDLEG